MFKKIATALLLILFNSYAFGEYISFPGDMCVDSEDTTHDLYYRNGTAFNYWSSAQTIICPMVLDNTNLSKNSTYINVHDGHSTEGVECTLYECGRNGGSCQVGSTKSSGGTGWQTISLDKVSHWSDGNAFIKCRVPGKQSDTMSGVASYRINN